MKIDRIFIALILLCLVSFNGCRHSYSDEDDEFTTVGNATISGTITQGTSPSLRSNGLAAANAKVWLEQHPEFFAMTDANGKFLISKVPAGVFKIVVKFSQGSTIFKVRSVDTSVKQNENTNLDLVVTEAKNIVKGTLKNEDGSTLSPGTKLYLWGEEFEVKEDGSFETPPLPDFQNIQNAINEIIVNFGLPTQIRLPISFGNGGQTQKVEFFLPFTPARLALLPRVSLINVTNEKSTDGVYPNTDSKIRAILFPENPEKIEWTATKGTLGQPTNISGTVIERTWTSPEDAGLATITVSVTNAGKTVKASLSILIKGTPKYSVTYSGNGNTSGEVPVDSAAYIEGATVTVKGNPTDLAKTGFTFSNWNTKADGTGTAYSPDSKLKIEKTDITLYAQWLPQASETYSIQYNGNGNDAGEVPTDDQKYIANADVTVKSNSGNLTKAGFTFSGWNTKSDGTGTAYSPDSKLKIEKTDITLYAQWLPQASETYSIQYNGNGNDAGEVPTDDQKYIANADVTVKSNSGNLTKAGFTFSGWNTKSDGTGTAYSPDSKLKIEKTDITLYAQWLPQASETYSIQYNGNGNDAGEVPTDDQKYIANADVTVKSNSGNLTKAGFTFSGWNTKSDGTGITYAVDGTFKIGSSDLILYAKWTPEAIVTHTVTFDKNGGTTAPDPDKIIVNAGKTVANLPTTPIKTGHTFTNWNTKPDGTGTEFTTATTVSEDITIYAIYSLNKFTVKYTAGQNGSINGSATQIIGYGSNGTAVTAAPATGYKFTGWSDGKTENPRTDTNISSNIDVSASFAPINAEVNASNKFAYGENAGWINFSSDQGKVAAKLGANGFLSGFAWGENLGWIKFANSSTAAPFANSSSSNWGVNISSDGKLSGFAYSENAGWINFGAANGNASINQQTGELSGYVWGENIGWIKLSGSAYKVQFGI